MTENEVAPAAKGGAESWDPKFFDDLSINDENAPLNTPRKEDQNKYPTNPFLLDDYDNMYEDRNMLLDCDVPVMEAFYQRDNVVKDIRVDTGVPEKAKTVLNNQESFLGGSDEEEQQRSNPSIGCKKTVDEVSPQMPSDDSSVEKKSHAGCDFEDLKTCGEQKSADSSKIGSPVDKEVEGNTEIITAQRSLGSFLSLVEDESNKETNGDGIYDRRVETESITFDFVSEKADDNANNEAIEAFERDASFNENAHDHHQPRSLTTAEDATKSDDLSEAKEAGPGEKQDKPPNSDEENTVHQSTADKSRSSPFQYDELETSFSAASLAGFSGPVAYLGSISHRSDASTTSARSFAFPVLQSEWNSSPVRMAKADRGRFRKHKGWRSGLFCCRF